MRRLAIVPFLLLVSCSDPAGPNGKFCDVVKRILVTADPMTQGAAFSDSRVLADGMAVRVKAYDDLVLVAPVAINPDAVVVSATLRKIADAFSAAGNTSSAANEAPISTLLRDQKFLDADKNVARYSTTACREK